MRENVPTLVVIHHTADSWNGKQYKKINLYHKTRWNFLSKRGSYMGYHFLIERDGELVQGREIDEEGAHTLGLNLRSIGVGFAGNFDIEVPTKEQIRAFTNLLDTIFNNQKWSIKDISFHREHAATSCPGKNMTETLLIRAFIQDTTNFFTKILLWINQILLRK